MYPKVFLEYMKRKESYGPVNSLPTKTFFYGMEAEEEITAEIDPGKTLEIRLQAIGDTDEQGEAKVFFELNGQPRVIRVANNLLKSKHLKTIQADPKNNLHIGAPLPGVISSVLINEGTVVKKGDTLLTIEAMKMETSINAERDCIIKVLHAFKGKEINAKDLLIELE